MRHSAKLAALVFAATTRIFCSRSAASSDENALHVHNLNRP
jgi:hypothetical protein